MLLMSLICLYQRKKQQPIFYAEKQAMHRFNYKLKYPVISRDPGMKGKYPVISRQPGMKGNFIPESRGKRNWLKSETL